MTTQAHTSTIQAPADNDFYKYGLKPVIGEGKMEATLKRLGPVQIKTMEKSNFVKPQSVMYELDGVSCFGSFGICMCMSAANATHHVLPTAVCHAGSLHITGAREPCLWSLVY